MRVLHVVRSAHPFSYGGIESTLMTAMPRLQAAVKQYLFASQVDRTGPYDVGVSCPELGLGRSCDVTRVMAELEQAIDVVQATHLHLHNMHIPVEAHLYERTLGLAHRRALPVVLSAYDMITTVTSSEDLSRILREHPPAVAIFPSDFTHEIARHSLGRATRALVVPSGIPVGGEQDAALSPIPTIVHPARWVARKGIARSIQVLKLLRHEWPGLRLRLSQPPIGRWLAQAEVFAEIRNQSMQDHVSCAASPADLYEGAWLTIAAPVLPESQGLTPGESLAAGVPAVVAPVGGLADYEGVPGVLTTRDASIASLTWAVGSILEDPLEWRSRARQGREWVRSRRSPSATAAGWYAAYEWSARQQRSDQCGR